LVVVIVIVNAGFAGRFGEGWTGFAGFGEG
jgi:hypothetical protein